MTAYTIQESAPDKTVLRTLTDQEALTYFPPQIVLSANKTTIAADGVDFALVTLQFKSVPLLDNQQQNLPIAQKVILFVAEVEVELTTNAQGLATHEIAARDVGSYPISAKNHAGNTLTIQAV